MPGGKPLLRGFVIDSVQAPVAYANVQVRNGARVTAERAVRNLELSGFYRRLHDRERGANSGHFITAEDIARRNPPRITQMIEGLPSVRVVRRTPPPGSRVQAPSNCLSYNDPVCWVPVGPGNCPMTVYLDGRRLNDLMMNPREAYAYGVDNIALPTHVAGIEVYSSAARVPPEYQAQLNPGNCGAIMIWTK